MKTEVVLRSNMSEKNLASNNTRRELILAYLYKNNEVSATNAAKIIGRSPTTARRVLSQLISEGLVVTTGENRNRKYKIVK
jgi:predicted ArsR family transcriptional regulator